MDSIVAGGYAISPLTNQISMARYLTNGTIDTSYGSSGITLTTDGNIAYAASLGLQSSTFNCVACRHGGWHGIHRTIYLIIVSVQPNNNIVAGGYAIGSPLTTIGIFTAAQSLRCQSTSQVITAGTAYGTYCIARFNGDSTTTP